MEWAVRRTLLGGLKRENSIVATKHNVKKHSRKTYHENKKESTKSFDNSKHGIREHQDKVRKSIFADWFPET
jgi:hypothetical protein